MSSSTVVSPDGATGCDVLDWKKMWGNGLNGLSWAK